MIVFHSIVILCSAIAGVFAGYHPTLSAYPYSGSVISPTPMKLTATPAALKSAPLQAAPTSTAAEATPLDRTIPPVPAQLLAAPIAAAPAFRTISFPTAAVFSTPFAFAPPSILAAAPTSVAAPPIFRAAPASVAPAIPAFTAAPIARLDYANTYPQYQYAYNVQDVSTGDSKSQEEIRDGRVVRGRYSLIEADGSRRIVNYYADPLNGFNAVVQKDAQVPIVAAAPVIRAPPQVVEV